MHKRDEGRAVHTPVPALTITRSHLAEMRDDAVGMDLGKPVFELTYDEQQQVMTLAALKNLFERLGLEAPFTLSKELADVER